MRGPRCSIAAKIPVEWSPRGQAATHACTRIGLLLALSSLCIERSGAFLSSGFARTTSFSRTRSGSGSSAAARMIISPQEPLPQLGAEGFSLASFNVLLPNSKDGWWIYKYFGPSVSAEHREWPHRQKLMSEIMLSAKADIVAIQEAAAESFEEDFAFMSDAGYSHVLHSKLRFRTATFFKTDRFELLSQFPRDRGLVTALKAKEGGQTVYVCNCHLSAGPFPDKRVRSLHDSLDQVRKEAAKAGGGGGKKGAAAQPPPCRVVVCGDFNDSSEESAVRQLLTKGEVEGGYVEPAYPHVEMSSKAKKQALGTFEDSIAVGYAPNPPPSTFIAPLLDTLFVKEGGEEGKVEMTDAVKEAVGKAFQKVSGGKGYMDREDIDAWLVSINKQLGRGSESRSAARLMEERGEGKLLLQDFEEVYLSELKEGKFWGVDYDLDQALSCGVDKSGEAPFQTRFDYVWHTSETLSVEAVRDPLTQEQRALAAATDPLPNSWHPSDHLIQSCAFRYLPIPE
uniref:Endonuclease/exonuclease/phosphatase domain-containing protein n=1 Tax=Hemiselmis andersenii TaxID=464988 RepID=A0A7S1EDE4_HEMAN